MNPTYECHITVENIKYTGILQQFADQVGWKFSCIDGDPDLGEGVRCFLTHHFDNFRQAKNEMRLLAEDLSMLHPKGTLVPSRQKVELILFDTKTNTDMAEQQHVIKWLRQEAKDAMKAARSSIKRIYRSDEPAEAWDLSRLQLGEAQAYERVIQHLRGLTEREFQIAKRKGTL